MPLHIQAVTALAGFYVGETYRVPWAEVPVPGSLTGQVFPFVEETLASLRAGGCQNQGTINFLELLRELRPFFWRVCSTLASSSTLSLAHPPLGDGRDPCSISEFGHHQTFAGCSSP